jgi:2'-5' RNA ligase
MPQIYLNIMSNFPIDSIGIFAPADVAQEVKAWQALFPASQSGMKAHVTVKRPFVPRVSQSQAQIEACIAGICHPFRPFWLQLQGLDQFTLPNSNVLYVAVSENPALRLLHKGLLIALEEFVEPGSPEDALYEGEGFVPHLTIVHNLSDEELPAARARLAGYTPRYKFPVTELALAGQEDGGEWRILRYFPLGGGS